MRNLLRASGVSSNGCAGLLGLGSGVVDEGRYRSPKLGFLYFASSSSFAGQSTLLRLRMQLLIYPFALSDVNCTLGRRELGSDQVLIDLGEPRRLRIKPVAHFGAD